MNGHCEALMQLGTGFNQELTGRENVYRALAYMGVTGPAAEENAAAAVGLDVLSQIPGPVTGMDQDCRPFRYVLDPVDPAEVIGESPEAGVFTLRDAREIALIVSPGKLQGPAGPVAGHEQA